jgi:BMFP domain-containing protein YqiC
MTANQIKYRDCYAKLSAAIRAGFDRPGEEYCDNLRRELKEVWQQMSVVERSTFLAPGCLDRVQSGCVNPDFSGRRILG